MLSILACRYGLPFTDIGILPFTRGFLHGIGSNRERFRLKDIMLLFYNRNTRFVALIALNPTCAEFEYSIKSSHSCMSSRPRQTRLPVPKKEPIRARPQPNERIKANSSTAVSPSHALEQFNRLETTTEEGLRSIESFLKISDFQESNRLAMKVFNAITGAIAAAHKTGWTTVNSDAADMEKLNFSIRGSLISLDILRQSSSLSTERAALNLVARLNSLKYVSIGGDQII
jgi:hypothetical protein